MARPPDVTYALDDEPSFAEITPLALQSLVVQSIYFLLPGIIASVAHANGIFTTNFLPDYPASSAGFGRVQIGNTSVFAKG
jgi:hypothetical protein